MKTPLLLIAFGRLTEPFVKVHPTRNRSAVRADLATVQQQEKLPTLQIYRKIRSQEARNSREFSFEKSNYARWIDSLLQLLVAPIDRLPKYLLKMGLGSCRLGGDRRLVR